jgi:hypothetical protein
MRLRELLYLSLVLRRHAHALIFRGIEEGMGDRLTGSWLGRLIFEDLGVSTWSHEKGVFWL